jgi:hypothetical protein
VDDETEICLWNAASAIPNSRKILRQANQLPANVSNLDEFIVTNRTNINGQRSASYPLRF